MRLVGTGTERRFARRLHQVPLVVVLGCLTAPAMAIPALHAVATGDYRTARAFLYSALLVALVASLVGVATSNYVVRRQGRSHLISILGFFAILPAVLAIPVAEAVPDTSYLNAYVEMVSSLTTTGMTFFEAERLPDSVHLWRATVGWLGGFFVWVTAIAILAPLNLGGFEVASSAEIGQGASVGTQQIERIADPSERLRRFTLRLAPIYGGLTLVLWIALALAGEAPLIAICHAMSTLSTSGISPVEGLEFSESRWRGEIFIFLFFVFALSRSTFSSDDRVDGWQMLAGDAELRLGLLIVLGLPALLFLRHYVAAFEEGDVPTLAEGLIGLWGGAFTVASFLTTTGFESTAWEAARVWSGLDTPVLLLMGLALFGGGVATTAGGVKLLRVYALYKHGARELEKLVMPSSLGGAGPVARRFRRQGAYVAWIFFMLFALSIALVLMALALTGLAFEAASVLTVSSLSTTGPLAHAAGLTPLALSAMSAWAKAIVAAAMVLGRLETLAIIALLNPEFWR